MHDDLATPGEGRPDTDWQPNGATIAYMDTRDVPPHQRFGFYADTVAISWEARLPEEEIEAFEISLELFDLGRVLFWRARGKRRQLRRSVPRTRADGQDHYMVLLPFGDAAYETMGEHPVGMAAGEVWLFDMARSLTLSLPDGNILALSVQRDALDTLTGNTGRHGVRLESLTGTILREQLRLLAVNPARLRPLEAAGVANAITHLLAASLVMVPQSGSPERLPLHVALMRAARRFVDANLAARDLSADRLCQVLRVSRSTLYRLMEPFGGVGAYVQQRRLTRVHALLSDPQDRRRIAELAFLHGFVSETHFSRAFRKRYGYAPRQLRNGGPLLAYASPAQPAALRDLYASWLLDA